MALDVGFENEWWNALSNDNVRDEIVAGSEEKHDVRLIGDVDDEKTMLFEISVLKNDGTASKKNKRKKNAKGKGKGIDAENNQRDMKEKGKTPPTKSSNKWRDLTLRVVIEKERRSNEARLFDELRDLNPHLPQTAFKTTIVIGAIKQIKSLEETLHRLQIQKERLLQYAAAAAAANSSSAPIINVPSSHATRVPINNNKGPLSFKTWTSPNVTLSVCGNDAVINICCVKKPGLNSAISFVLKKHNLEPQSFHVSTVGAKTMLMIRLRGDVAPEFADGFSWEEKYKKVAAEIMVCVNA